MTGHKQPSQGPSSFAELYPNIASWVRDGWVEIGRDDYSHSFVRALDVGGMVWEGAKEYDSLEGAFEDLDAGIAAWIEDVD